MRLFERSSDDEGDGVRWLTPTQVRQRPRRRVLPFALLTAAVIAAGGLVVASVRLSGPEPTSERTTPPAIQQAEPSQRRAEAPPSAPIAPTPPPQPAAPEPSPPTQAQALPAEPTPSPQAPADVAPAPTAPEAPAGPADELAGAFPPASAPPSDDADATGFAAYLNESAPDQNGARTLVIDAQRRYANVLGGGRLSYRRVRLNDGSYAWRLRLSGLTHEGAARICAALVAEGAGCEVGPR